MTDLNTLLSRLLRPRLLVRAARHARANYVRARHLPRLLGPTNALSGTAVAARLASMEEEMDEKRCRKDASYSPTQHIDVLTALIAEAELLSQTAFLMPARGTRG